MKHRLSLGLALLGLAAPLAAQSNGVTMLSRLQLGGWHSEVWGYTAPDGREYGIIGTSDGTFFINVEDPTAPYVTGFVDGPDSIWREMKTWDRYCYIVTEGGGGVQIVDLLDPENPRFVKTWGGGIWGNAHTISVDLGTGRAYVNGTNRGMVVLDLANPENPVHIATYNGPYVHDCHVQNGKAHLAHIYDGQYRIVNADNLNFPTLDTQTTPGQFTHNTWANASDTLCVTTDESGGGRLTLYDISSPNNIRETDRFTINSQSIVHNAYIIGNRIFASWYSEGFVCVDISDPYDMKLAASYDTSAYQPGSGYHGAWGCYPFAQSGLVYISDIEEGFYVLRIDGPSIAIDHAPLENTENQTGPYVVMATVAPLISGATITDVTIHYRVDNGSWQSSPCVPTGNPDEWAGGIPGQPAPSLVEYYLLAEDDRGHSNWLPGGSAPGDNLWYFTVGQIVSVYFNDFEAGTDSGWTHGAYAGADDWARGTPAGKGGEGSRHIGIAWNDPNAAYSGTKVWANDLGSGVNDGAYEPNTHTWLESPAIDCSGASHTNLFFRRWLTVEAAPFDFARIYVNNTLVWENPQGYGEYYHTTDVRWQQQVIDISALADGNPSVKVRFELEADHLFELGGWAIDDFRIASLEPGSNTDTISLSGPSSVNVGQTATFLYTGAPASSPWWLYYSLNQNGTTINGHLFDIGAPVKTLATGTTTASGAGSWTSGPVPGNAGGRTYYIEMRVDHALTGTHDSNMLTIQVP
ncbi:MAG: choice-of-anchor B family protein [Planctomycetota bacterium]|nr:MAG: choice-of-anchor B family protein [Planctomycetota bacterium]